MRFGLICCLLMIVGMGAPRCAQVPAPDDGAFIRPQRLNATASVNPARASAGPGEGVTVTLRASAIGGTRPYRYRWSGDAGFASGQYHTLTVRASSTKTFTFRLEVTDAAGDTDRTTTTLKVTVGGSGGL